MYQSFSNTSLNTESDKITTLAQYGNIMVDSKDLARARGTGAFNPPPRFVQSTNRGYAFQDAYPMYVNNENRLLDPSEGRVIMPDPIDINNIGLANFNTPSDFGDALRKRAFVVGDTGLHPGLTSWNTPEYEGADSQYVTWALKALQMTPNPLLIYYFSKDNVEYLQKRTIQEVKRIRNIDISPQSVDELLIIMRSNYLYAIQGWLPASVDDPNVPQNRGEKPCSLEMRLSRLNQSTIEETVKQVFSGIDQYNLYTKDIQSLPMPLSHPIYASMSGSKQLSENIGFNSGHEKTLASNSYNMRFNII